MKVFVSGSRGVSELPAEAKASLDKIRELGFTVLVGDCYGVDALVQNHLKDYRLFGYVQVNGERVGRFTVVEAEPPPQRRHALR